MRRMLVLVGLLAFPAPGARADDEPAVARARASDEGAGPDGEAPPVVSGYQGVAPGADRLPPRAPRLPVTGPARVTWSGFQVREGVPTVFVQLTGPVEWTVAEEPGRVVYTLRGATIPLVNNRRPLDTTQFGTAVRGVTLRARGRDVQLVIRLAHKVSHRARLTDGAGGFKLLLVEIV